MKKIRNILIALFFFMILLLLTSKVDATSISASPSSPKVGQSVTITVSVPNVNTVDLTATVSGAGTSGTIRLVDGSMTGSAKTFSKSITVTPTSAGTIKVSVSSSSNAVLNGSYVEGVSASKSISVTNATSGGGSSSGGSSNGSSNSGGTSGGKSSTGNTSTKSNTNTTNSEEKTVKSTDNSLSALTVAEGTISPEFSKDVKEYTVNVPYNTDTANITATPTDGKATVAITGNTELKEGENTATITVTAEDGTTTNYTIKITKARTPVALQSLIIKYQNQNGELIEIPLNPEFNINVLEYSLEDLEYWVDKLEIEAVANLEGATIDIQGADSLNAGENIITITVKIPAEGQEAVEGEELEEETITYTIKVNKKEEPTLIAKIEDWFKGIFGTISTWYNENTREIIIGSLGVCIIALIGLSAYIVVDYNKYKDVIAKTKKVVEINKAKEVTNSASNNTESVNDKKENIKMDDNKKDNLKGGKHF